MLLVCDFNIVMIDVIDDVLYLGCVGVLFICMYYFF